MSKALTPIPFAGSQLDESRHVCAFFNTEEEEYRVLLPFINDGFKCGDKAVHVVNPHQCEDHLKRLAAIGVETNSARQSGQLEIKTSSEVYLQNGRFDQDRMLEAFEQMASGNVNTGFPLSGIATMMQSSVPTIFRNLAATQ